MSSEIKILETNDIIRRRKLRIQQVREQSKDIAKKIQTRVKLEKLRHIVDLDSKKERKYLETQEKLVQELEQQYLNGLKNVGGSHKNATDLISQESVGEKLDLSQVRGKAAATQLHKKKQQVLDERNKILGRKLEARKIANEISREKGTTVANKIKSLSKFDNNENKSEHLNIGNYSTEKDYLNRNKEEEILRNDMGTQWESGIVSKDWTLNEPKQTKGNYSDKVNVFTKLSSPVPVTKKLNLFALSDEMPSSLRGGSDHSQPEDVSLFKPSNLISDYLQNRTMHLREPNITAKRPSDDLQKIKETITQTRASKTEGKKLDLGSQQINSGNTLKGKNVMTMYNHSTRNARNIQQHDDDLVVREFQTDDDAYSQAIKESVVPSNDLSEKYQKKLTEMRHKVAVAKDKVDKEYKDTLSLLKCLPKNADKGMIEKANLSEFRQKEKQDVHQRKMQHEFKKIEKECRKQTSAINSRAKSHKKCSNSFVESVLDDDNVTNSINVTTDHQYSWMPVPDSDGAIAIHKIQNSKEKIPQAVKFDDEENYHEYRSRHKHTPPTKDISHHKNNDTKNDRRTSADDFTNNSSTSYTSIDSTSEEKSIDDHITVKEKGNYKASNERIIICKILDDKQTRDARVKLKRHKLAENIQTKSVSSTEREKCKSHDNRRNDLQERISRKVHSPTISCNNNEKRTTATTHPLAEINEGLYKSVGEKDKGDNMTSFNNNIQEEILLCDEESTNKTCQCSQSKVQKNVKTDDKPIGCLNWQMCGDNNGGERITNDVTKCSKCGDSYQTDGLLQINKQTTSTSSFKTVTTDKSDNSQPRDNNVRLINDIEEKAGNFYVGASGFLRDDAYEVIIQLRKKDMSNKRNDSNTSKDKLTTTDQQKIDTILNEPNILDINTTSKSEDESKQTETDENKPKISISKETSNENEYNLYAMNPETFTEVTYPVDTNVVESVVPQRPGMSIHTQTSAPNSPIQQRVLFHMSSSASTTYMSPPDVILPKILKQSKKREFNTSDNCEQMQDYLLKMNPISSTNKTRQTQVKVVRQSGSKNLSETKRKKCNKQRSHKCKKLKQDSEINIECERRNIRRVCSNFYTPINENKKFKTVLKPQIKKYVNKLLALNRESSKAIEVATQYCSSVSTPTSSIVNISSNVNNNINSNNDKIFMERIKNMLMLQKISKNIDQRKSEETSNSIDNIKLKRNCKKVNRKPHKVKSLHISKNVVNNNNQFKHFEHTTTSGSSSSSTSNMEQNHNNLKNQKPINDQNVTTKNFPLRPIIISEKTKSGLNENDHKSKKLQKEQIFSTLAKAKISTFNSENFETQTGFKKSNLTTHDNIKEFQKPINISTQTNKIDDENLLKLEENKVQNMEKIADLTEKCTKRLTDLAKILEEVRKNKSNTYSQLSSSDTSLEKEQKSDKNVMFHRNCPLNNEKLFHEKTDINFKEINQPNDNIQSCQLKNMTNNSDFVPILLDVPKPIQIEHKKDTQGNGTIQPKKCKPPPALSRINLKMGQENLIPHELSTVPEIDSPSSFKHKNKSSSSETKSSSREDLIHSKKEGSNITSESIKVQSLLNSDILEDNLSKILGQAPETSKMQMMDVTKFKELMLKPFVSLEDYVKQYNAGTLDEGSNLEDMPNDIIVNDEISSLHSDGSLPDVISELLKRNIISEPFKFDSVSNVNSTTISSESSLSVLALSKKRKDHNNDRPLRISDTSKGIQGAVDTSDTLSISSNPDLENAFKRLGMGWASSTLKKTKERQALLSSSSSSTSSTSKRNLNQFEKSLQGNIPVLISDSLSRDLSELKISFQNKPTTSSNKSRNVEQQTSLTKSMTVKEFLTNELAKRITFTSNSQAEDTEKHYTSLYSTKFPNESVNISGDIQEKEAAEKVSQPNSRQRTSTPVQLFKSMTYNTNSSSNNNSNGLFSNMDDLSSVKVTSSSLKINSHTDKEELSIPNYSLRMKKNKKTDHSKSDD